MTTHPRAQQPVEHDPFAGPAIAVIVPTTEPQREIWVAAHVSDEASLSYNESVTLWLRGSLDVDALRGSLADVTARHDALRATFSGDGLTMLVAAQTDLPFEFVDWSAQSAEGRNASWSKLLEREATEPFDLTRGPLARAKLVRIGETEHRLVFTAHHIVCDGWSTAVVVREWAALYSARVRRTSAALGPEDGFASFARAHADPERVQRAQEDESYWVAQYAEGVPVLELPLDRPRPPLKTYASFRLDGELDAGLVRDLRKFASGERASLFAALFSGFGALMSRLSGQNDIVVGVPAAGQSVGGHDSLVGHCVNMLPLRATVDADEPFRALLGRTRTRILDAYEHQEYTFGSLLRRLPLARDPSRLPLVSVVFNLDRGTDPDTIRFEGLTAEQTTNPRRFENFDLFLNAVELAGKVSLECQYNADLFDGSTIRRWFESYARLLRSAVETPDQPVGRLAMVPDGDLALLDRWNDESTRPVSTSLVHELVEAQVARTPAAIAVEMDGMRLTYADLDSRADALAWRLRDAGVRKGSLVGLCVERSPEMLVGLLGILKAGGAYVPLDPEYPSDRLAFMVRDSRMAALVTQEKLRSELKLDAAHVIVLGDEDGARGRVPAEGSATPTDPAYVIYTSGSTGTPKGVLVPHGAVVNLLESVRADPGMSAADVVLAVTTLSFDIAVSEVVLPLTVGARIVLASREVASDGERLLALLRSSGATFVDATPATWRLLLTAGWAGGEGLRAICTGEALPTSLAAELVKRCAVVHNGYGPTETTVWSTFWKVANPVGRVLIGKPVANTRLYVLDARMQRVPVGVVGELFIGGAGVSLGYHERPDLTRERFLPDPFAGGTARMYKTGDLVRFLPDGNLECLGRNDTQVKIRGYRIELGEIENVLSRHPAVAQAAALAREDRPGDVRLVAYVAAHTGSSASDAELRAHLKLSLPDYMVPQHFVRVATMPTLPNGKIDRRKLPAPTVDAADSGEPFVAPRTDTERKLATLWQEVLAVGRVGVHDDFFALGGHSLLASQLIARLRRAHGFEVSFRKIFEAPTIEKLAAVIDASAGTPAPAQEPIVRRNYDGPAPASIAQRRIWLLEEMDPAQRLVHNLCASWRLEGALDEAALRRALDEVVRRHEPLRTNFVARDGEPRQVVAADRSISIRGVDLTDRPESERRAALDADRDAEAVVPFDLATDPLLRVTLYRLSADVHVLSTVQHNIVWDGWSFDLFLGELSAAYGAFARGEPSPLEPLPVSYADYAEWQSASRDRPELKSQVEFWQERLSGALLPLEIPTDRPRGGTRSHAGGSEGAHVSSARAEALTALAREHGATLFMLIFAAFNVLLYRYTGQRDLLVGTPVRARTRPELENLIGPFVNAIALRTRVEPSMTFLELLERVRGATLDAFNHQDVPLDALGDRPPMLRALFSLQDARNRPTRLGDLVVAQEHALAPVAANELMLWAMQSQKDLLLMLNFATDLFDVATARRILAQMDVLLAEIQRDPGQRLEDIPLLPPEELAAIEKACGVRTTGDEDVRSMLAAVAARAPGAVAVTEGDRSTTYAELAERVEAFAESASRAETAAERVVAFLGTLKAAGTYVTKGTTVSQGALIQAARAVAEATHLGPTDVLQSDARFDGPASILSALVPLAAGARIVVATGGGSTVAKGATGMLGAAAELRAAADVLDASEPFVFIVYGPVSSALAAKLSARPRRAFSLMASEELGLPVGIHELVRGDSRHMLGRPLRGVRWRVADTRGRHAPTGVTGALFVEAVPELPTGDRARLLSDGSFEWMGRVDGRLRLDDGLVDPRSVAEALGRHPAVREAWVTTRDDASGATRLVAYYASRPHVAYTETELRACTRDLGGGHVPRLFLELDELPRDAAGAVDDERLPSPYVASSVHEYVPPRSASEQYLAKVWRETLNVQRIGVHDNFFDLGGHSLLCFRVLARVQQDTGKRISPRVVLLNTLAQVAAQLDIEGQARSVADPRAASPAVREAPRTLGGRLLDRLKGFVKG